MKIQDKDKVNTIAYVKIISTNSDDEKKQLTDQVVEILTYSISHNFRVNKILVDKVDSQNSSLNEFNLLMSNGSLNDKFILILNPDVLTNDPEVYLNYFSNLYIKGLEIISISTYDKHISSAIMVLKQFLKQETPADVNVMATHWVGPPFFGYTYDSFNNKYIDEADGKIVKRIFQLKSEGFTDYGVAKVLKAEGLIGRSGKTLHITSITRIVNNRKLYEGYVKNRNGEWVRGDHEPILK